METSDALGVASYLPIQSDDTDEFARDLTSQVHVLSLIHGTSALSLSSKFHHNRMELQLMWLVVEVFSALAYETHSRQMACTVNSDWPEDLAAPPPFRRPPSSARRVTTSAS
ncbi:hypothetical protein KC368_g4 [Hortaea werneckii]|nr:hypothetical protein KC368_g4 [Hortaea werneckii]